MPSDDERLKAYLQAAHDRGGGYEMAMRMMIQRIGILEDRLDRNDIPLPDTGIPHTGPAGRERQAAEPGRPR